MPVRSEPWPPGAPCWVDLGVPDVPAARAFYSAVLGWTYSGGDEPQYGGYLLCETSGGQAAGMGPQQDPDDPPRWTTYLATEDADATAAAVTDNGGALLVGPFDVGPLGRMAIARDPQGLPFGLWQSGLHTGATVTGERGSVVWSEANVPDTAAARRFYGAVLGVVFEPMPGERDYATWSLEGAPAGGIGGPRDDPGWQPGWLTSFHAGDVDAAVAAVTAGGGSVLMAPQDSPHGRVAVVADPWGARFALMVPAETA